jgi:hypothetical protein
MQTAEIYISHLLDSGSGFAARTDDGEQAFVPASVVKASGIDEGDIVAAKLIPNTHPNNSSTPWVAVHVAKPANTVSAPVKHEPSLDERAYEAVCDLFLATTAEVGKEVGTDVHLAHNALLRLFKAGRVAKADVYARADQERASYCIWAVDPKDFLGEMGNE